MLSLNRSFAVFLCLFLIAAKTDDQVIQSGKDPIFAPIAKVIDGVTFETHDFTVRLWGIKPPPPASPHAFAALLYLQTSIDSGPHSCYYKYKDENYRLVMQCFFEGKDIAQDLVRMGVASADKGITEIYNEDEAYAKQSNHGIWGKNER